MGVSPAEVGIALDLLEIKISKCQIGIFGYGRENKYVKPMADVPDSLKTAIRENLTDGKLACRDAWKIAEKLGIGRMDVASACDTLGIKIFAMPAGCVLKNGLRAQTFDLVHGREPFDIAQDHGLVEWLAEQGSGRKVKKSRNIKCRFQKK